MLALIVVVCLDSVQSMALATRNSLDASSNSISNSL